MKSLVTTVVTPRKCPGRKAPHRPSVRPSTSVGESPASAAQQTVQATGFVERQSLAVADGGHRFFELGELSGGQIDLGLTEFLGDKLQGLFKMAPGPFGFFASLR